MITSGKQYQSKILAKIFKVEEIGIEFLASIRVLMR